MVIVGYDVKETIHCMADYDPHFCTINLLTVNGEGRKIFLLTLGKVLHWKI